MITSTHATSGGRQTGSPSLSQSRRAPRSGGSVGCGSSQTPGAAPPGSTAPFLLPSSRRTAGPGAATSSGSVAVDVPSGPSTVNSNRHLPSSGRATTSRPHTSRSRGCLGSTTSSPRRSRPTAARPSVSPDGEITRSSPSRPSIPPSGSKVKSNDLRDWSGHSLKDTAIVESPSRTDSLCAISIGGAAAAGTTAAPTMTQATVSIARVRLIGPPPSGLRAAAGGSHTASRTNPSRHRPPPRRPE